MQYSNPLPPEGINTTATHSLKEFALLAGGLLGIGMVVILFLGLFADRMVQYIPFEAETRLASSYKDIPGSQQGAIQQYLQHLADDIGKIEGLPDDMHITVHYVRPPVVNAMATLGGHIIMFEGLFKRLHSEDAVAMVLAHEVAHIRYRHPIRAMGRGFVMAMALSVVSMGTGVSVAGDLAGEAGLLTVLTFNREQEQQADFAALRVLARRYGHVAGALALFNVLEDEGRNKTLPHFEFLNSHPLTQHRIQRLRDDAKKQGWAINGQLTPVSNDIQK